MIAIFWALPILILWVLASGIVTFGMLVSSAVTSDAEARGGWFEFPLGVMIFGGLLIILLTCLALLFAEIRLILKLRGHRCREMAPLERTIVVQIACLIGSLLTLFADVPAVLMLCFAGECATSITGLDRYYKLKDSMANAL